jgi:hypothetical protein
MSIDADRHPPSKHFGHPRDSSEWRGLSFQSENDERIRLKAQPKTQIEHIRYRSIKVTLHTLAWLSANVENENNLIQYFPITAATLPVQPEYEDQRRSIETSQRDA